MIPQLRDLEQRFPNELVVVGVHSGKYIAERDTARIRDASIRLGNTHPIVNDRQFRVWRSYAVNAWPTIVVLSPEGRVIGQHAGEFTADELAPAIERLIPQFEHAGTLDRTPLHFTPDEPNIAPRTLRYPGKVAVDGRRIAIADSGHGRVLVGTLSDDGRRATIDRTIDDFVYPQGMTFAGDTLYIADAYAHIVYAANLRDGKRTVMAGTGHQIRERADLTNGSLSSPWDVALVGGTLFIATAGTHQLHAIDLGTGDLRVHAGTRREDIEDGPNLEAALAQPMGITAAGDRVYFADAESSAIRGSDTVPTGSVHTFVGTGLFDFGDKDGSGDDVRMQHQQGLTVAPDGRILVADSYNDALKWLDPRTRRADTWIRGLHEPSGVALTERFAYIADTNAHRVALAELESGDVTELDLRA